MDIQIQHNFGPIIQGMLAKAKDYHQPLTDFYGWMIRRTQLTFSKLGRKGNTAPFRETIWRWFAPQYTREKGIAKIVPAEGGVDRVNTGRSYLTKKGKYRKGAARDIFTRQMVGAKATTGPIWGRLRHSNTRITSRSMIMRDQRMLEQAAISRFRIGNDYLIAQTPVQYAKYQQAMRPFVFMIDEDIEFLRKQIIKYLTTPGK
jgi:hypothetical protein